MMEVIMKVFAFLANVLEGEKWPWITLEMFVKGSYIYLKKKIRKIYRCHEMYQLHLD